MVLNKENRHSVEVLGMLCVRYAHRERERQRQTEKDGSDVTVVALKLVMSSHFP